MATGPIAPATDPMPTADTTTDEPNCRRLISNSKGSYQIGSSEVLIPGPKMLGWRYLTED